MIPLTRNEIARLFAGLTIKHPHDDTHQIRWSNWRRRHQHRAKTCHYRRQAPGIHEGNDLRLEY